MKYYIKELIWLYKSLFKEMRWAFIAGYIPIVMVSSLGALYSSGMNDFIIVSLLTGIFPLVFVGIIWFICLIFEKK